MDEAPGVVTASSRLLAASRASSSSASRDIHSCSYLFLLLSLPKALYRPCTRRRIMARSVYSPSPSPSLRSNTPFSDSSSDEDIGSYGEGAEYGQSASRPGSPQTAEASMLGEEQEADTMTCQWEECGKVFNHLPTLIDHIHNGEFYV